MSKSNLLKGTAFIIAFLLYVAESAFQSEIFSIALTFASFLLFLTAIIGANRFYFWMSILLMMSSVLLFVIEGKPIILLLSGFPSLLKLILFISLIPLISYPVGGYVKDLISLVTVWKSKVSFFKLVHYFSFFLSNLINLAAIPIAKVIFIHTGMEGRKRLISIGLIGRSFSIAMMITPIGAAIAVAIELTGTKWMTLLPVNLMLIFVALWLSYTVEKGNRDNPSLENKPINEEMPDYKRLLSVLVPLCLYFAFLFVIEGTFHFGIMETIALSVLPFTFIWSLFLKDRKGWVEALQNRIFIENPNAYGLYSVIISASLLIYSLEITGIDLVIIQRLPWNGLESAAYFYIPLTIMIIFTLSLMGVHQFVGMIFVANLIDSASFGINETIFASALLAGFVSGMMASAFSGANILISSIIPEFSSLQIAKNNRLFVWLWMGISSFLLILMNHFYM